MVLVGRCVHLEWCSVFQALMEAWIIRGYGELATWRYGEFTTVLNSQSLRLFPVIIVVSISPRVW